MLTTLPDDIKETKNKIHTPQKSKIVFFLKNVVTVWGLLVHNKHKLFVRFVG